MSDHNEEIHLKNHEILEYLQVFFQQLSQYVDKCKLIQIIYQDENLLRIQNHHPAEKKNGFVVLFNR